jgi:hypothetical protein
MNEILLPKVNRVQRIAMFIAGICCVACAVGVITSPGQFFISYLFAIMLWLGLSLGCLAVAMIHHLTAGRWGDVTRRFLEAGYMTLPLMAVLFVPIFFGLRQLYPWARPAEVAASEILRHKALYLNTPGFLVRSILFFAIWLWMAFALRRYSLQQDATDDLTPTRRARVLSGPGIVIYSVIMTFASVDWIMSLEADWYSTMFGVIICIGQILAAFAFGILLLYWFKDQPPISDVVEPEHFHDLGNLLLTFVMFWTYINFGQLLVIWAGNLPHEISWYLRRIAGSWEWMIGFIALFNFFLPFFILLFREAKKNPSFLAILAAIVFVSHAVTMFWVVEPSFFPRGIHVHWLDFAAPLAIGGLWVASFIAALKHAALLPRNDPRISYSFAHA